MELLRRISVAIIGLLGIGAPITVSSHKLTRETIWDQVSEDAVPNDESSKDVKWEVLKSKLFSQNIKTNSLKALSSTVQKNLKEWCFNAYNETYKSAVVSRNTDLLSDVKNFCWISIKEQLEEGKRLNFSEESELKARTSELRSGNNEIIDQEEQLKKVKASSEDTDRWNLLKEWCQSAYERGYQGNNSKWQLVNLYCIKKNATT